VAIGSNAYRCEIEEVLGRAGLGNHFDAIVSVEDVVAPKPDREVYVTAAARLAALTDASPVPLDPVDVVVFEDSPTGVAAARAAGMRCVALAGNVAPRLLDEADLVVEGLDPSLLTLDPKLV
jgi:sugar-phosphatase